MSQNPMPRVKHILGTVIEGVRLRYEREIDDTEFTTIMHTRYMPKRFWWWHFPEPEWGGLRAQRVGALPAVAEGSAYPHDPYGALLTAWAAEDTPRIEGTAGAVRFRTYYAWQFVTHLESGKLARITKIDHGAYGGHDWYKLQFEDGTLLHDLDESQFIHTTLPVYRVDCDYRHAKYFDDSWFSTFDAAVTHARERSQLCHWVWKITVRDPIYNIDRTIGLVHAMRVYDAREV